MFPVTSRYYGIEIAKYAIADGNEVAYLRRRFIPAVTPSAAIIAEHKVVQAERLDNITARYLGDPEQFWRICDANNAMLPEDLLVIGRRLLIVLPQGA